MASHEDTDVAAIEVCSSKPALPLCRHLEHAAPHASAGHLHRRRLQGHDAQAVQGGMAGQLYQHMHAVLPDQLRQAPSSRAAHSRQVPPAASTAAFRRAVLPSGCTVQLYTNSCTLHTAVCQAGSDIT